MPPPPRWIGRYLALLGAAHVGVALVGHAQPLRALADAGAWDALASVPDAEVSVWVLLAGVLLVLVGGLLDAFEAQGIRFPRWFAAALLLAWIGAVILAPFSLIWLLLPAVVAALRRRYARPWGV